MLLFCRLLATTLFLALNCANAALPTDACIPPTPLPVAPSSNAAGSTSFTAYSPYNSVPFTIQFWREACAGLPLRSNLYIRVVPGAGARVCGEFRIQQAGQQYGPDAVIAFGGAVLCTTNLTQPITLLLEQDYRDPMFMNNGPVTLIHQGSVFTSAALPAYTGAPTGAALVPAKGLWWNPNESGTGYNLDVKHNILVVTVFSYKPNGDTEWYLSSGPLSSDGRTFVGTLDKYRNGQCISCAYGGRPSLVGSDGQMTITFSSETAAVMTLPGGRIFNVQPQDF